MSNYNMIRTIISQISGQENIVVVPKLFVKLTGDLTTAILLNQIVFYSDKSKRTDGYFYKSYKEWEEEICLTKRQVSYSTAKLKEMGLVETKLMKANGAPTLHYKLDYDKLVQWIVTNCNNGKSQNVTIDSNNMSQSLTEITTKTTTEITTLKDNMSSDQKERSKDCIPYEDVVSYLNKKVGKSFKHKTAKTRSLIKARFKDGFTIDDFKKVIDIKAAQWLTDSNMSQYLRPETLFGNKFEGYVNEKIKGVGSNASSSRVGSKDSSFINKYDFTKGRK
ncbi:MULTISPECIES: conserved phage C-terminal domain-containing protein [Bacillus]|uniref:conserved phage C-terminal domain-containing protein n=1 Tax=Bacillus TaxID=1386 RepID=UPI0004740583|nr:MULTISPECIES: conserved phage C-terminal domain-containing protein [Bacillus cereus group]ANE89241.1 replication protein [Bacillus cereus]MDA2059741.1 conserved phage C-terminal domain-containing protein [Bacillus cereus]PFC92484.1 replication protein [Bacillus cereus]PFD35011.1 replication protein [Bacillus thuringiensis]PGN36227.1 replication protein [Bacillus cereus]